jgi:hypothetical protein
MLRTAPIRRFRPKPDIALTAELGDFINSIQNESDFRPISWQPFEVAHLIVRQRRGAQFCTDAALSSGVRSVLS